MTRRWGSIRENGKSQTTTHHKTDAHFQKGVGFDLGSEPKIGQCNRAREKNEVSAANPTHQRSNGPGQDHHALPPSNTSTPYTESLPLRHLEPPAAGGDPFPIHLKSQYSEPGFQYVCQSTCALQSNIQFSNCARGASDSTRSVHKRRWRKISEVFRSGSDTHKHTFEHRPQSRNMDENKLGLPLARTPWRNPTSPLPSREECMMDLDEPSIIDSILENNEKTQLDGSHTVDIPEASQQDDSSPQLQVQIPLTPLERFSVMFSDIHGGIHSDSVLGGRKNITLDTATRLEKDKSKRLDAVTVRRRATSPTSSQFDRSMINTVAQARRSSKYSLFPTTPVPTKSCSATSSPAKGRRRSVTAPTELLPLLTEIMKSKVRDVQRPQTSSQSSTPFSASIHAEAHCDKNSLRTNSDNEIFFDVKSLRGSNGLDAGQFEMTRPPSSAVQLARSQSSARKVLQKSTVIDTTQKHKVHHNQESYKQSQDASFATEETTAMIQFLASTNCEVLSNESLDFDDQATQSNEKNSCEDSLARLRKGVLLGDPETEILREKHTPSANKEVDDVPKTHTDKLLIQTVDETPSSTTTDLNQPQSTGTERNLHVASSAESQPSFNHPSVTATHAEANLNSSSTSLTRKPTLAPLSKYATKQIKEDLVRETSIRPVPPVRPGRANTDNDIHSSFTQKGYVRPYNSKRASSLPSTHAQTLDSRQGSARRIFIGPLQSSVDTTMPTMIAYTKPAAEVSIARKVSVVRKQSARIVDPKASSKSQISTTLKELERATSVQQSGEVGKKRRAHVDRKLPVVQEVHPKYKPGGSVDILLDGSSSPLPPDTDLILRSKFEKALPPIPVS